MNFNLAHIRQIPIVEILWQMLPNLRNNRLILNLFYILIFGFIQTQILSTYSTWQLIDFITPWIIIVVVLKPFYFSFACAMFAALFLESSSSVPHGFYFCFYWLLACFIAIFRNHLSWRVSFSWFATIIVGNVCFMLYELVYFMITQHYDIYNLIYLSFTLLKTATSILFGYALVFYILNRQSDFIDMI